VAAEVAHRLGVPLALAHAVEMPRTLRRDAKASRWLVANRKRTLHEAAVPLSEKGLKVEEAVRPGPADETLLPSSPLP
jgi:hypothetical protein